MSYHEFLGIPPERKSTEFRNWICLTGNPVNYWFKQIKILNML